MEQLDGRPALNQKPIATPLPWLGPSSGVVVVRMVAHRLEDLDAADAGEPRAVGPAGALLRRVHQSKLHGVDAQLLGQLADDRLGRERDVRGAGRPVRGRLRLVDDDVVAVDQYVRDVVDGEDAHAAGLDGRSRPRAGLERDEGLRRDDLAVLRRADLDPHVRARGRAGGLELLGSAHHDLHRVIGLFRQQRGYRLPVGLPLAAEAAADLQRRQLDHRQRHSEDGRRAVAHLEWRLRAVPDVHPAVLAPVDGADVGLDVALVHGGRVELPLDYDVRLGEPLLQVAVLVLDVEGHVRRGVCGLVRVEEVGRVLGLQVVEQHGCAVGHALGGGGDRGQHLVVDLYQPERLLGDVGVRRRHAGHRMALVERLLPGEDGVALPLHVRVAQGAVVEGVAGVARGQVRRRHGRHDAGERIGLAGVDRLDPCVGVGAAQHLAVEQLGGREIGPVLRLAGHLLMAVVAHGPRAHHVEGLARENDVSVVGCRHVATSYIFSAASITARTILS